MIHCTLLYTREVLKHNFSPYTFLSHPLPHVNPCTSILIINVYAYVILFLAKCIVYSSQSSILGYDSKCSAFCSLANSHANLSDVLYISPRLWWNEFTRDGESELHRVIEERNKLPGYMPLNVTIHL